MILPVARTLLSNSGFLPPKQEISYLIYRILVEMRKYTHSDYYLSWNTAALQQIVVSSGEKLYEELLGCLVLARRSAFQVGVSV